MEQNQITVYTYTKVFNIDNKIYSIWGYALPVPIKPMEILSFVATLLVMIIVSRLMPFILFFPFIIRYGVIPYFVSKILLQKKFDGKNPIRFLIDYIKYLSFKNNLVERNQVISKSSLKKLKINWCSTRRQSFKVFNCGESDFIE